VLDQQTRLLMGDELLRQAPTEATASSRTR
jgi:hypothetical protein